MRLKPSSRLLLNLPIPLLTCFMSVCAQAASFSNATIMPQKSSSNCVDVSSSNFSNGTSVQIWNCNSTSAQKWSYSNNQLRSQNNKCLDLKDGSKKDGAVVQLWDCVDGNTNQQWVYSNGTFKLANTNLCLDLTDGSLTSGKRLQVWTCVSNSTNQSWTVKESTSTGSGYVPSNYKLVWSDEFTSSSIDTSKWNYEVNCDGGGNNEEQCYTQNSANSYIEDGKLVIKLLKQSYNGKPYTSARLTTKNKGDFTYGYFESRLKVPCGQGLWPAFWMLPTDNAYGTWPTSGEIDIMEILGEAPTVLYGTCHFGPAWPNQLQSGGQYTLSSSNFCQDYHVFGVLWTSSSITFSVDGKSYFTMNSTGQNWNMSHWPFDKRFYMILNVAMGGDWPKDPDPSITSAAMYVDYVRAYAPQ